MVVRPGPQNGNLNLGFPDCSPTLLSLYSAIGVSELRSKVVRNKVHGKRLRIKLRNISSFVKPSSILRLHFNLFICVLSQKKLHHLLKNKMQCAHKNLPGWPIHMNSRPSLGAPSVSASMCVYVLMCMDKICPLIHLHHSCEQLSL